MFFRKRYFTYRFYVWKPYDWNWKLVGVFIARSRREAYKHFFSLPENRDTVQLILDNHFSLSQPIRYCDKGLWHVTRISVIESAFTGPWEKADC